MKDSLRDLIASGKTETAIQQLLKHTDELGEKDLHQEALLQSARFEEYRKSKRLGVTSNDQQNRSLAQINQAILSIIDLLPENRVNVQSSVQAPI